VKKVSACSLVEGSGTGCVVDSAVGNGSAGGRAAEEDGEGQMSEAVINGCLVRDMRSELVRLELEASGLKRILLQRLLAAQSEGRKIKKRSDFWSHVRNIFAEKCGDPVSRMNMVSEEEVLDSGACQEDAVAAGFCH
jgi:hypothetical protein